MAVYKEATPQKVLMGKLSHGKDLLQQLNDICRENNIKLGRVEAIGAVQKARIGFYDQNSFKYEFHDIDQPLEIANLTGNISLRDGQPFIHTHITLADSNDNAIAGHLAEGTIVFACEFIIQCFDGPDFIRDFDEQTKLPLWKDQ